MSENYKIRPAELSDLALIQPMFDEARAFMRQNGNMTQWDGGYPSDEVLKNDIETGALMLCFLEDERAAVFALCGHEKTYDRIYQGAWLNDAPYHTVHRIACVKRGAGVAGRCLDYVKAKGLDVRADTHRDNIPMQRLLLKNGFQYCGIIYLQDGSERQAYQFTAL